VSEGFREVLLREIELQKKLQKRMGDFNENFDHGIMWQIRMERLELLEKLLAYEPEVTRG
jgi:hypothetical protein